MAVYLSCYQRLFFFPLAAESSADIINISEVDCTQQGKYKYVEASISHLMCVISNNRSYGREKQNLKLTMSNKTLQNKNW